jgi:hypothetical protein
VIRGLRAIFESDFLDIAFGYERKSKPRDEIVMLACFVDDNPTHAIGLS